jgi:DNA-binding response OmpR family regulator
VLERDTMHRFSTERILRREDYWVFVTEDAAAAARVAAVSAVDLVLVDLELDVLLPVPPAERRRADADFHEMPSSLGEGYAILRPLQLDPQAQLPIVTLRLSRSEESVPACRFALVGLLAKDASAKRLVQGLAEVFGQEGPPRDGPGRTRGRSAPLTRPFESTPVPLRSALVVDPDVAARRALVESLVHHAFTVYEAASGEDALRVAVARRPWLVVTETQLADESGHAFCRRVRSHSLLRRTALVFLSEQDDCDSRYEALQAGADDYLVKPAPSRELLVRIELLLRRFADIPDEEPGAGLRGEVELMGALAVLQTCHLSQLTGVLMARRGTQSLRIAFRRGQIVSATGPDHHGADVIYDFIAWPTGQFEFDSGALAPEGLPMSDDFNALLLEGCRRLDERRRGRSDSMRL